MSFFDIVGLPGVIRGIVDEGKRLQDRASKYKSENPKIIGELPSVINYCQDDVTGICNELIKYKNMIPPGLDNPIVRQLEEIKSLCTTGRDELAQIIKNIDEHHDPYEFFRANAISNTCNALHERFQKAGRELQELTRALVFVNITGSQINNLRECIGPSRGGEGVDIFRPHYARLSGPEILFQNPGSPEERTKQVVFSTRTFDMRQIIGLQGAPGTGKTSCMRGLTRIDEETKRLFCDGSYWIGMGSDTSMEVAIRGISKIVKASGGESRSQKISELKTVKAAFQEAQWWFGEKRILLFVDDVWEINKVTADFIKCARDMVVASPGSKMVFTTRDREIVGQLRMLDSESHIKFSLRDATESKRIFMRSGAFPSSAVTAGEKEVMSKVLNRCNGLPLSLDIAGRYVAMKAVSSGSRQRAMEKFEEDCGEQLLDGGLSKAESYPGFRGIVRAALLALEGCLESLGLGEVLLSDMFGGFCILKKQQFVPIEMLATLWVISGKIAAKVVGLIEKVGLGHCECARGVDGFRLHDITHDVVQADNSGKIEEWNAALLRGYRSVLQQGESSRDDCGEWWILTFDDGGYYSQNLIRHLRDAGLDRECVEVALRPEWIVRQLEEGGILQVDADIRLVVAQLEKCREPPSNAIAMLCADDCEAVAGAVRLSMDVLLSNGREAWIQLYGRLVGRVSSSQGLKAYLNGLESTAARPWLKPLQPCLPPPGEGLETRVELESGAMCMGVLDGKGDGKVVVGCRDGNVCVVELREGRKERAWVAHDGVVSCLAVSDDSKVMVTGGVDGRIRFWKCDSWEHKWDLEGDGGKVSCLGVSGDGSVVFSGSAGGSLAVWDGMTGAQVCSVRNAHGEGRLNGLAVMPCGKRVVTVGEDKMVRMWRVEEMESCWRRLCCLKKAAIRSGSEARGRQRTRLVQQWAGAGHVGEVYCVAVGAHNSGERVVSGAHFIFNDSMRLWDAQNGAPLGQLTVQEYNSPSSINFSADGKQLASGDFFGKVHLWDVAGREEVCEPLVGHSRFVTGVAVVSDGARVVSCSEDGTVRTWNWKASSRSAAEQPVARHNCRVSSVALVANGTRLVSGSWDGTLRVWDVASGRAIGGPLTGHGQSVVNVTAIANSDRVVSFSLDKTVRVWNVGGKSHHEIAVLTGHTDCINSVAVTPDGACAITASDDTTVRVWDIQQVDGSCEIHVLKGHSGGVRKIFVSEDGKRAVSADLFDWRVWDIRSGECLQMVQHGLGIEEVFTCTRAEMLHIANESCNTESKSKVKLTCEGKRVCHMTGTDIETLVTLDEDVMCYEFEESTQTLCVGLENGQVVFFRLVE